MAAGIVTADALAADVAATVGRRRSDQLDRFIGGMVGVARDHGLVGLPDDLADALAAFRAFNYERIYLRPASVAQADAVVRLPRSLVAWYADRPGAIPRVAARAADAAAEPVVAGSAEAVREAVAYVAGMTDRYACRRAVSELGWDPASLPRGVDLVG